MQLWPIRRTRSSDKQVRADTPSPGRLQELLIICHGRDPHGQAILDNVCRALDFAKMRFSILDLERKSAWPALDAFSSIVICTELIWALDEKHALELETYVRSGGGLTVAYRCWNTHLSELFGTGSDATEPAIQTTRGLSFDAEVFPGASGLKVTDSNWVFEHSRFPVKRTDLSSSGTILISDLAGNPVLWRRDFGKGKLVYWNTGILFCRALRGFALQSILDSMDVGVSAIAGFAMFHIDDFPTSLWDASPEPVASEFPEHDWNSFFFGIWHEDMMALRAKYDLKYSWYTIIDYHDVSNRPDADQSTVEGVSGREILQQRFRHIQHFAEEDEYGFHGYNHDPLTTDSWPDPATLRSKLLLARSLWEDIVPAPLPTSWVPANNWYQADHARAIKDIFPEISVVCGLFSSGDPNMGEYREFGPEPWESKLLCLPRETSGYMLRPETRMMMLSQIAGMGIWTHFVHPDDVYDVPDGSGETAYRRNPDSLGWRASNADGQAGLISQLDAWLAQVRQTYPWLKFLTTSHAEEEYHAHIDNQVDVRVAGKEIRIASRSEGLFYVRTREGALLVAGAGGYVVDCRPVDDGQLHIVKCSAGGGVFHIRDA